MSFHSFPQEIGCHKTFSAHFLRKSLDGPSTHFLEEIGRMWIASVSNSRYAEGRPTSTERGVVNGGGSAPQAR